MAKQNLLGSFKARFTKNSEGQGYIFYPKESEQGYACTEADYLKFTANFQKFLKRLTRIMWFWFLVGMPIIIVLAVWQKYELTPIDIGTIVALPIPFLVYRGWKVYTAPEVLAHRKRPISKARNQKQIFESRIRGMSWTMLTAMTLFPLAGCYVFLTDTTMEKWKVTLGLCGFISIMIFGAYLIFRKWKIEAKE